jgi:microcystin-dependent protein
LTFGTTSGFYIVENLCTGNFYVLFAVGLQSTWICAPPGQKQQIYSDLGSNAVSFVNMPPAGTALDLHCNSTNPPVWISSSLPKPYLVKDGTVYNVSDYPALGGLLGSTYGGNGATTFGVPDERSRFRLAVDTGTTGRVTAALSGVNGTTFGSAGGDQSLQSHNHIATDSGHNHASDFNTANLLTGTSGPARNFITEDNVGFLTRTGTASITVGSSGGGGGQNMPPCIVSFLPLIKT